MKTKTINKVIREKLEDWISSVKDKQLQELIKRDVIVTGGCIASMFLKEKVNDYDVYFKTIETTFKVCEYYSNEMNKRINAEVKPQIIERNQEKNKMSFGSGDFKSLSEVINYEPSKDEDVKYRVRAFIENNGVVADKNYDAQSEYEGVESEPIVPSLEQIQKEEKQENKNMYYPVYISTNAITLSHKIQIVLRFYGNPEIIHDNYDFAHCTNYWTFETGLVTNIQALECLLSKELKYFGSRYPLASILRTKKFINRDWKINAGQYIKMVFQLNEMDLQDVETLEEQLTGVDIAYMHDLIKTIKSKKEENPNFEIKNYFISVVEKIFD